MILKLSSIVSTEYSVRSWKDERRKVNRTIASYRGDDGFEYRKSFEAIGEPQVLSQGTHQQLNNMKYQWST